MAASGQDKVLVEDGVCDTCMLMAVKGILYSIRKFCGQPGFILVIPPKPASRAACGLAVLGESRGDADDTDDDNVGEGAIHATDGVEAPNLTAFGELKKSSEPWN